jgi:hypothetical protein
MHHAAWGLPRKYVKETGINSSLSSIKRLAIADIQKKRYSERPLNKALCGDFLCQISQVNLLVP